MREKAPGETLRATSDQGATEETEERKCTRKSDL